MKEIATESFVGLFLVGVVVVGVMSLIYYFELYRVAPGWGPILKYESMGDEDLRISQLLVQRQAAENVAALKKEHEEQQKASHEHIYYGAAGTIGPSTWGNCEASWQWREPAWHPQYGMVNIRHGFNDTQYMRAHIGTWARDEPHFLKENGVQSPPLSINSYEGAGIKQQMVV
eukprot:TRINITY_DN46037_c0_g1_i1.p1 TRINITY_DN46037_c0_g1~~TRINITY_DN46037_c0_g1_i1.p1  ORF type:complete len:173 (-),score=28.19 TRINITY_DN46037_c0_g1_i1:127-645(-)